MPQLRFSAHLPLLRVAEPGDGLQFKAAGFDIWRMPFAVFDDLSSGAFRDHQAAYDACDPLFLALDLNLPENQSLLLPAGSGQTNTEEIKIGSLGWDLALHEHGLDLLRLLHERVVEPYLCALALVAPASLPPPACWSCSFLEAEPGWAFARGTPEAPVTRLRVQGDADLEYLLAPAACNAALPARALHEAAGLMPLLPRLQAEPSLAAALRTLRAAASPPLQPQDRELLCTTALEALLLPEVRSGLRATFVERVSPLMGGEAAWADALYAQRSDSRHGEAELAQHPALPPRLAVRTLAAALRSALLALQQGQALAAWQQAPPRTDALPADAGAAAAQRITPPAWRQPIVLRVAPHGLRGPDDAAVAVVPLVGLGAELDACWSLGGGVQVVGLAPSAVVALEDKDIARDFLSTLHLSDQPLATLQFGVAAPEGAPLQAALAALHRPRALAVCALRLAGVDPFIDPSLAGLHVLRGLQVLREASVLRQTVLMRLRHAPQSAFGPDDAARVRPLLALLLRYDAAGGHADAERWLQALRRLHQAAFLPADTRLGFGYALLESLLGRFRDPSDPQGPEQLAQRLPGCAASADWLVSEGRALRNALAHGRSVDADAALVSLQPLLHTALPLALQAWLEAPQTRPARSLRRQLLAQARP